MLLCIFPPEKNHFFLKIVTHKGERLSYGMSFLKTLLMTKSLMTIHEKIFYITYSYEMNIRIYMKYFGVFGIFNVVDAMLLNYYTGN